MTPEGKIKSGDPASHWIVPLRHIHQPIIQIRENSKKWRSAVFLKPDDLVFLVDLHRKIVQDQLALYYYIFIYEV